MANDYLKISLRQLQIFLAIDEYKSLAKAAEYLELTAPAVSMQMSKLAEHLKAPLFEKDGRSVRLTQEGKALVPYAQKVSSTLLEASREIEELRGKKEARVSVAMVSTARNFGPLLLQKFKKENPEARLKPIIMNRRGVIDLLDTDEIDIAVMGRTPKKLDVDATPFATHPYVLICHPNHPLAKSRNIHRSDLVHQKFFIREVGSGTRMVHDHFFRDNGLELPRSQTMEGNENIKQAVMVNMGLAFISKHTISLEYNANKLAIVNVKGMPELREWFVIHKQDKLLGAAARSFKSFAIQNGEEIIKNHLGEA